MVAGETIPSDLEIAQAARPRPIVDVAAAAGLGGDELELYGRYKAKVLPGALDRRRARPDGMLVVVTAMTPTLAGEGKTTVTVGLGQALVRAGRRAVVALREPAMGPVFGAKGGATGGGYAQVLPMEDINLHFTGDFHAIGAANNLLAAVVDNHLHQGNALDLDARQITWRRCLDVNDRALRQVVLGLGGTTGGVPRESGFDITPASEVMAVLCLAEDLDDLHARLGRMLVGYTRERAPVHAADLGVTGALAALLRDALHPNLVQTLEGGPALVHGGPFANIAHGTTTLRAIRLARKLGDTVLVEAGFGSDLGFEKFCHIVARQSGMTPDGAVVVATVRALKRHGGQDAKQLTAVDVGAARRGLPNLLRHVANVRQFGVPALVALNVVPGDTEAELQAVEDGLAGVGVPVARTDVFRHGGAGGAAPAEQLATLLAGERAAFAPLYEAGLSLRDKITVVAQRVYGAAGVEILPRAAHDLARIERLGYGHLPVCMAKTQYSFSDDPNLLNAPEGFTVSVRGARLLAGAGFVVVLTGELLTMPALGKHPAAERITVSPSGTISGLA